METIGYMFVTRNNYLLKVGYILTFYVSINNWFHLMKPPISLEHNFPLKVMIIINFNNILQLWL